MHLISNLTLVNSSHLVKSGILEWTLDSGSKGSGFDSRQCLALFVLQQDTLSTLLLSTQVYKWVPGRMRTLFVAWIGIMAPVTWRLAGILLREWKLCTVLSAEFKLNPMTGVIIICARCDIVVLWIASLNAYIIIIKKSVTTEVFYSSELNGPNSQSWFISNPWSISNPWIIFSPWTKISTK